MLSLDVTETGRPPWRSSSELSPLRIWNAMLFSHGRMPRCIISCYMSAMSALCLLYILADAFRMSFRKKYGITARCPNFPVSTDDYSLALAMTCWKQTAFNKSCALNASPWNCAQIIASRQATTQIYDTPLAYSSVFRLKGFSVAIRILNIYIFWEFQASFRTEYHSRNIRNFFESCKTKFTFKNDSE